MRGRKRGENGGKSCPWGIYKERERVRGENTEGKGGEGEKGRHSIRIGHMKKITAFTERVRTRSREGGMESNQINK